MSPRSSDRAPAREVTGSIIVGSSDFFFFPRSCSVDFLYLYHILDIAGRIETGSVSLKETRSGGVWYDIKPLDLETRRGRNGGEHNEDGAKIPCNSIHQSHIIWLVSSIYFISNSNVIPFFQ